MSETDRSGSKEPESTPPVAADDFPEFAEPPKQRPAPEPEPSSEDDAPSAEQEAADAILERLRRERGGGGR